MASLIFGSSGSARNAFSSVANARSRSPAPRSHTSAICKSRWTPLRGSVSYASASSSHGVFTFGAVGVVSGIRELFDDGGGGGGPAAATPGSDLGGGGRRRFLAASPAI